MELNSVVKLENAQKSKLIPNCTYCGKSFNVNSSRKRHEKRCSSAIAPTKATKNCPSSSSSDTKKTTPIELSCSICSQSFKHLAAKIKHEKKHELPGGFTCCHCQETFTSDADRLLHKQLVHKQFRCSLCDETFTDNEQYDDHKRNVHNGKDRSYISCEKCAAQFKTPAHLKIHNESKCGTIKTYACKVCDAKFMTRNTLTVHMMIHTGEKKHLCDFCGNSFLSKGQLKVHERSHTKEKPFKCDVCDKAFSYRESLVTHSSLHTGIKPYMCEQCSSRFSCIGNLIKHRRSRPNSCGLPQYSKNLKIAPRASARNIESLSLKAAGKKSASQQSSPIEKRSNGIIKTEVSEMPPTTTTPTKSRTTSTKASLMQTQVLNTVPPLKIVTLLPAPLVSVIDHHQELSDIKLETINNCNQIEIIDNKHKNEEDTSEQLQQHQTQQQHLLTIVPIDNQNYQLHQQHHEIISNVEIEYITSSTTLVEEDKSIDEHYEIHFGNDTNLTNVNETNTFTINEWDSNNDKYHHDTDAHEVIENVNEMNDDNDQNNVSECYTNDENNYDHDYTMETDEIIDDDDNNEQLCEYTTAVIEQQDNDLIDPIEIVTDNAGDIVNDPNEIEIVITDQDGNNLNIMPEEFLSIGQEEKYEIFTTGDYVITDCSSIEIAQTALEEAQNCEASAVNFTDEIHYKCENCPRQYKHEKPYAKHLKKEHGIIYTSPTLVSRKRRTLIFAGKNVVSAKKPIGKSLVACKICQKEYSSITVLRKHEVRHGKDGTLLHKCACCPNYFSSLAEVEKHQTSVHDDKLNCRQCNKTFKEPENLSAHVRYAHDRLTNSKPKDEFPVFKKYLYVCPKCGKNFAAKIALSDHERSECGEQPLYKCNVCDKSYHSAGSLKTHLTVHTGELPHLCKFCGKAFRTQGQVKVHERKHNGEKPFKCEFCEKSFAYRESLLTHLSLHTGVKRFMCQACGNRFSCISNLQAHRKTHRNTCGLVPNMTKPVADTVSPNNENKLSSSNS